MDEHGYIKNVDDVVPSLAGLREGALTEAITGYDLVVTCEEHSIVGGLGGLVAEDLAESGLEARLVRIGLPGGFPKGIGSQEYLREVNFLDASSLVRRIAAAAGTLAE